MRIGDMIHSVTNKLHIEACDECKKRQAYLNELGEKLSKALGMRKEEDKNEVSETDISA